MIYVLAIALVLEKNLRVMGDCITDIILDKDSTFDIGLLLNTYVTNTAIESKNRTFSYLPFRRVFQFFIFNFCSWMKTP